MTPKLNIVTPLPPKKSGIANYVLKVMGGLSDRYDLNFVVDQERCDLDDVDARVTQFSDFLRNDEMRDALTILHMGNNIDHSHVYRAADHVSGLVVQHDLVLHHFLDHRSHVAGDFEEYAQILEMEYGKGGRSLAAARSLGLVSLDICFLFPANYRFIRKARSVIVHSHHSRRQIRRFFAGDVRVIPHFADGALLDASREDLAELAERDGLLSRLNIPSDRILVASLGFAFESKCIRQLARAVTLARRSDPSLHLVIGGEIRMPDLEAELTELRAADAVTVTGYLSHEDLESLAARADLVSNLRFPSAGESSGILSMAMAIGVPCMVFDFGPMGEFSDVEVIKVAFDVDDRRLSESLAQSIGAFMRMCGPDRRRIGEAAKKRMREEAAIPIVRKKYVTAIESVMGDR